jgi:predicted CopG family antitoxin
MRTTVSLDDDVTARLKQIRKGRSFKELINTVLRAGLDRFEQGAEIGTPYSLQAVEGKPRRTDLDNVAELIAEAESDAYK